MRALSKHRVANEIVVARDGVEALDYLHGEPRRPPPQLVLLDRRGCILKPLLQGGVGAAAAYPAAHGRRWDACLSGCRRRGSPGHAERAGGGKRGLSLPVIFLAGTVGEEVAVAALRAGH